MSNFCEFSSGDLDIFCQEALGKAKLSTSSLEQQLAAASSTAARLKARVRCWSMTSIVKKCIKATDLADH